MIYLVIEEGVFVEYIKQNYEQIKTKEDILNYRIKHPNCSYCQFLSVNKFSYNCKKKNIKKIFLFNNEAKFCKEYVPRTDNLELTAEIVSALEL